MKQWLNKIDSLFVFLLLSLVTLFLFMNNISFFISDTDVVGYKNYVDFEDVFEFPKQGKSDGKISITNYNPSYNIYYSTDGGKNYKLYKNESLLDLKSPDITKKISSIREKKPFGYFPSIISLLVKAKHEDRNIFTREKQITYFENIESSLPIINLLVNEDHLFDEYKGIMTLGENSWQDDKFYKAFWDRNANYKQRGGDWQQKVYFQYFEENKLKYETVCGIQISGNATRSFPQKSFKLKATKKFGGDRLDYPFFGDHGLKKYKSLVIRNSGNDNTKTLFADLLMQKMAKGLPVLTQEGHAVNVFINGNYWGVYNLRERYDSYFIGKSEKVKSKKVTLLEGGGGELKSGNQVEQEKYISFIDSIYVLSEINNELLDSIKIKIDLESFSYYILLECFYGNGDWLNNNAMWYKADKKKWKWLLNDLDYGLAYNGYSNVNVNYFSKLTKSNSITAKLFNTLMRNINFKNELKLKSIELIASLGDYDEVYNNLKIDIEQNIDWQINRWRGNFTESQWNDNCNLNLNFLKERKMIFLTQVEDL